MAGRQAWGGNEVTADLGVEVPDKESEVTRGSNSGAAFVEVELRMSLRGSRGVERIGSDRIESNQTQPNPIR